MIQKKSKLSFNGNIRLDVPESDSKIGVLKNRSSLYILFSFVLFLYWYVCISSGNAILTYIELNVTRRQVSHIIDVTSKWWPTNEISFWFLVVL